MQSERARLPVWVRGTLDSDTFVVILHGGPGSSGTQYFHLSAFAGLEARYGVVYWDQRSSGFAQGRGAGGRSNLNAASASTDVDAILAVIQDRYAPGRLFLLGHSWGGVLGTAYLAGIPQRQEALDGWIEVDGGHNWRLGQELSVAWVQDRARSFVEGEPSRRDAEYWRDALDWYAENPLGEWDRVNSMAWIRRHVVYVDDADGYWVPEKRDLLDQLDEVPGLGWHSFLGFSSQWAWFDDRNPPIWEREYDVTAALMSNIELPTLIAWGEHDGILPVELAEDARMRLGTPDADKRVVIFDDSAHSPMFEEPDAFDQAVIDFVEGSW